MIRPMRTFALSCQFALAIFAILSFGSHATAEEKTAMQFQHYMIQLHPVRPAMALEMNDHEQKVMGEHFNYLKGLTQKGIVLMAGPVLGEPVWGLVVVKASTEEEVKAIADKDPSVIQGVNTYTFAPMIRSLMSHNVLPSRYADSVVDRMVRKEVTVTGTCEHAWKLWSTTDGLRSWFTPNSTIELKVGGKFEILFSMEAPEGMRGSEGCRVLSFLPNEMLSFEWNAPPQLGEMRDLHHFVVVQFDQVTPDSVRVRLSEYGFGAGEGWDKVYDYFDKAWGMVLGEFAKGMAKE